MSKGRLEAFSDGVLAIIITIMVLELKAPQQAELSSLRPIVPIFFAYVLSFISVGIYWNNHHHLLQAARHVDGRVLWANLHLLFWLSLVPFVTGWMGQNHIEPIPTAAYGIVLMCAGIAYYTLAHALIAECGPDSRLARAFGPDRKGKLSIAYYAIAIVLAFVNPWIAVAIYVGVAMWWLIPDRRIEKRYGA